MQRAVSFLKIPVVYHTLFWISYFLFNFLRWGIFYNDYAYSFKTNLVEFTIYIILVYFVLYFLMPRLVPKQIPWFIIYIVLATLIMSYIKIIVIYNFVTQEVYKEVNRSDIGLFDFIYVAEVFIGELYVLAIATSIKLTMDWIRVKNRTTELEKSNLETELAFLKSQIQPHFFFNTLNNLYSLTLDKSTKAPYTVLKLSELMSYVIYEAKQKRVPLIKEINHIQNYLDLERLRFGERLEADLSISGEIEGKSIPPVLLLPFIENSFKHGSKTRDNIIPIDISLEVQNHELKFTCKNRKQLEPVYNNELQNDNHGIGLQNTKRRLKLLFGDRYDFRIAEDDEFYQIALKIPLNENKMPGNR